MRIGSLFAGIGGLELGLEWAGLGPVVWQVEIEPYCRKVLAKHWPDADRSVTDVRDAGRTTLAPVDLICGGFPCQDISTAGKGAGLAGSRSGLWGEFARVVGEMQPTWVVVENVHQGGNRWIDAVVCDLAVKGYEALPIPLRASAVGAWHERARTFVVANAHSTTIREQPRRVERERGPAIQAEPRHTGEAQRDSFAWWSTNPDVARVVHGVPAGMDRRRALGNSVVPQCAEVIGWVIMELEES